jgi:hypothetical protein
MKQKRVIPTFKSESEEAEWWYKNRGRLDKDLAEAKTLKRLDQTTLKGTSRRFEIAGRLDPIAGDRSCVGSPAG